MDGIFVGHNKRAASKAAVRRFIADDPTAVVLEATSLHGDGCNRFVSDLPAGRYAFVGPNPYTDRRFYGTIEITFPNPKDDTDKRIKVT